VTSDPVRDEAERLVAAAIAALSVASRSLPGLGPRAGFATGSDECCVCPVCRAIAAMREPNPEFAERLATGAADLATGVASLLRSLSRPTGDPWRAAEPDDGPDPWHDATTAPPEPAPAKKPMAKKAVKKAAKKTAKKAAKQAPGPASSGLTSEERARREDVASQDQAPARAKRAPRSRAAKKAAGE
jgi:hypothetical protein